MSYVERQLYHLVALVGFRVSVKETSCPILKCVPSPACGTTATIGSDLKPTQWRAAHICNELKLVGKGPGDRP